MKPSNATRASAFKVVFAAVVCCASVLWVEQPGLGYTPDPPPCQPTTSWCDPWNCDKVGSVDNPGKLSKTSETICVGGAVTPPTVSGTTFKKGYKSTNCQDDCGNEWVEGQDIDYTPETSFDPSIPGSFPNCGISNYAAKVKGVTGDTDCPTPTDTKDVGTFTVTVVAVTGLDPELADQGGLEPGSDPPTYWVCPCPGDVIVTASSCPNLTAEQLPSCWTFTGGVEIDKLHHKVSKEALLNGPVTFTVTAGTSTRTIILKADEEQQIYRSYPWPPDCKYDNFTGPPETDICGHFVSVSCVGAIGFPWWHLGHYEYYWDGIRVGYCYFYGGENAFLFKTTKHQCRILRTWHLTQELTPTRWTRWVVTKFDCVTFGGNSYNCRTAPAWDSGWGRPADELLNEGYPENSCENRGTPFTPCPPETP